MKIHIMGASCAGSTTLGTALAKQLNYPLFDSDEYFWEATGQPFTVKRDPELRNAMMLHDVNSNPNWILTGSMVSWGPAWLDMFDLVVFLYIPHHIRMQRLHNRELERYGDAIFNNPERAANYQAFIKWAAGYDDNTTKGRTLQVQENWLSQVNSPILEIRGDTTVQQRMDLILEKMKEL